MRKSKLHKPLHIVFAIAIGLAGGTAGSMMTFSSAYAAGGGGSGGFTQPSDRKAQSLQRQYRKGVRLAKKGDYEDALIVLNQVIESEPGHADALNYMGYCHRKLGDYKTAYKFYRRALMIDKRHRGALEYLGELFLDMDDLEKAKRVHARLDEVCDFGCAEEKALYEAIRAYEARAAQ